MEAYRVGLLEVLTKGDVFSWHMLFVLLIWNVDMTCRDATIVLGDEKESQVMRTVEQNGRRMPVSAIIGGPAYQGSPASL